MVTEKTLNSRIALKIDTSSNWTTKNTILKKGELAFVTFTNSSEIRFKIGDGVKTFTQLPYQDEPIKGLVSDATSKTYSLTITPTNWTASGSSFIYNYSNASLRATVSPIISCTNNSSEYNYITSAEATANSGIKFTVSKKPTANIILSIVDIG